MWICMLCVWTVCVCILYRRRKGPHLDGGKLGHRSQILINGGPPCPPHGNTVTAGGKRTHAATIAHLGGRGGRQGMGSPKRASFSSSRCFTAPASARCMIQPWGLPNRASDLGPPPQQAANGTRSRVPEICGLPGLTLSTCWTVSDHPTKGPCRSETAPRGSLLPPLESSRDA